MPREQPATRTDEWITPPEIVDLVLAQYGSLDLDPCAHPESPASKAAALTFDLRRGEDGLTATWPQGSTVFVNPPYGRGQVRRWAAKCVAHAAAGGECLLLINDIGGTDYARREIWPHVAAHCRLSPRVAFIRDGVQAATMNLADTLVCYFGHRPRRFEVVWLNRGSVCPVIRPQREEPIELAELARLAAETVEAANMSPAEQVCSLLADLVARGKVDPSKRYERVQAAQAHAQAVRAEHGAVSFEYVDAEHAASQAMTEAMQAIKDAARFEAAAAAFIKAAGPTKVLTSIDRRTGNHKTIEVAA